MVDGGNKEVQVSCYARCDSACYKFLMYYCNQGVDGLLDHFTALELLECHEIPVFRQNCWNH